MRNLEAPVRSNFYSLDNITEFEIILHKLIFSKTIFRYTQINMKYEQLELQQKLYHRPNYHSSFLATYSHILK